MSLKKQTGKFLIIVIIFVITAGAASFFRYKRMEPVSYEKYIDETILTVDGEEYRLRDLAFYIAFEESTVEEQARVYNHKNTNQYWNIHTNDSFLRHTARDAITERAVHDIIFYQMAKKDELVLTDEEREYMMNEKADFWNDLTDEQRERIIISEKEIEHTFEKLALAQKEQRYVAEASGVLYAAYETDGDMYAELLQEHEYQVNDELWKRFSVGNITLSH